MLEIFQENHKGWNEDRIDSLFKPRRIVDLKLNSMIDEIVPMGEGQAPASRETGGMDDLWFAWGSESEQF